MAKSGKNITLKDIFDTWKKVLKAGYTPTKYSYIPIKVNEKQNDQEK